MNTNVYKCTHEISGLSVDIEIADGAKIASIRISVEGDTSAKRTVGHLSNIRRFVGEMAQSFDLRNGWLSILPKIDSLKLTVRIPDEVSATELRHFLGRREHYRTLRVEKGHNGRKIWICILSG